MSQTLDDLDNGCDAHSVDAVLKAIHTNVNVRVSCYNVCVVAKYCNFDTVRLCWFSDCSIRTYILGCALIVNVCSYFYRNPVKLVYM